MDKQYREVYRKFRSGLREALRHNEPKVHFNESMEFLRIIIVLGICILMVIGIPKGCHASDKCDDPGLKPELKKACYQMEKVCAEVGCAVSVR